MFYFKILVNYSIILVLLFNYITHVLSTSNDATNKTKRYNYSQCFFYRRTSCWKWAEKQRTVNAWETLIWYCVIYFYSTNNDTKKKASKKIKWNILRDVIEVVSQIFVADKNIFLLINWKFLDLILRSWLQFLFDNRVVSTINWSFSMIIFYCCFRLILE